jgi:hypothetical protein
MSVQLTGVWGEVMVMPFGAAELFESHSLFEEGGKVFCCFSIGFLIRYVC